jgi:hypothetical protein
MERGILGGCKEDERNFKGWTQDYENYFDFNLRSKN